MTQLKALPSVKASTQFLRFLQKGVENNFTVKFSDFLSTVHVFQHAHARFDDQRSHLGHNPKTTECAALNVILKKKKTRNNYSH